MAKTDNMERIETSLVKAATGEVSDCMTDLWAALHTTGSAKVTVTITVEGKPTDHQELEIESVAKVQAISEAIKTAGHAETVLLGPELPGMEARK